MHCGNCGTALPDDAKLCYRCGTATRNAAARMEPSARAGGGRGEPSYAAMPDYPDRRSRVVAGLLGIFLGSLGVHRFYLGFIGIGVAQCIVTLVTCGLGGIWGFVEGILCLARVIDEDADGVPLRD